MAGVDVMRHIGAHPGQTAVEISRALGLRCASLSSYLRKQVKTGVLMRKTGCGPRGGYGYFLVVIARRTQWERLRADFSV